MSHPNIKPFKLKKSETSNYIYVADDEGAMIYEGYTLDCPATISRPNPYAHLIAAAPEMYELLAQINMAFYTRTSRKDWLTLMEKTKPLLRRARGEL